MNERTARAAIAVVLTPGPAAKRAILLALPFSLVCGLLGAASKASSPQEQGVPSLGARATTAPVSFAGTLGGHVDKQQAGVRTSHLSPFPAPPASGGGAGTAGACNCTDGIPENEPNCGQPWDPVNGGCNSGVFSPISLGDTICGTTFFEGPPFFYPWDLDYYEIVLTQTTKVQWTVKGDFMTHASIIDGTAGCPGVYYAADVGSGCNDPAIVSATLPPGTWWFSVDSRSSSVAVSCGTSYTATLEELSCNCTDGIPENEPNCGQPTDTVNGGCDSFPAVFSPIRLGDTICGTTYYGGIFQAGDSDWYEIVLAQTTSVTWKVTGDYQTQVRILDGTAGCPGVSYGQDDGNGCDDPATLSATLPPGRWWFVAGMAFASNPLPCGTSYTAELYCTTRATANFRNDTRGTNPAGYLAAPPIMGAVWSASVDNNLTGNTWADIVGYATPTSFLIGGLGDYLLVNLSDPGGELTGIHATPGSGVVNFSAVIPTDPAVCGFTLATQGYGFGGGGSPRLQNAYDLKVGGH